jgi:hypothetical protein
MSKAANTDAGCVNCGTSQQRLASSCGGVLHRLIVAALGIVVVCWCAGMPVATADDSFCTAVGKYCAFFSPSHRIGSEINTGGYVGPDSVYCQTVQSVHMDNAGLYWQCWRRAFRPPLRSDDGPRPIQLSVGGQRGHLRRHEWSRLHNIYLGHHLRRVTTGGGRSTGALWPSQRRGLNRSPLIHRE